MSLPDNVLAAVRSITIQGSAPVVVASTATPADDIDLAQVADLVDSLWEHLPPSEARTVDLVTRRLRSIYLECD